jgi:2-polyprenyl-3-methyl-5-hydroxy-6-metoxy-1,4-benzoquinol methylase
MQEQPANVKEAPSEKKEIRRLRLARILLRAAFQSIRPKRLYEPVDIAGRRYAEKRDAQARWKAIAEAVEHYGARNVLDVGCAEAWFLRQCAENYGCFAVGIEANPRRVLLGELARLHDGAGKVAVLQAMLSPEDIESLPAFDLVLCLSVVHHVMRQGGVEGARAFLRALATRTRKAMLFEMGTSEEKALQWTGVLPDMPRGQEAFVSELLASAGFLNIRPVVETPGLRGDAARILFVAEPAGAA